MDEHGWHRAQELHIEQDLASIVLAEERPRRSRAGIQRPMKRAASDGYDARSVLILAIVVALLAAIVGWAMTLTRDEASSLPTPVSTPSAQIGPKLDGSLAAGGEAASGGKADSAAPAVAPAPRGVQLMPTRITGSRAASGGGILRIAVANRGREVLPSAAGVQVVALVNGTLIGPAPLGAVDASGSASVELYLNSCPTGSAHVVAVVDPSGIQRETSKRDNTRGATVSFGC
ncbi:MAG: hypothetical protein ABI200_00905 [Gaiellales bacterium]